MQVRNQNRPRAWAASRGELLRIEVPVARVEIDEHRHRAHGFNATEIAGKIVAGQQHFVARFDSQCSQGQLHGECAGATERHEFALDELGQVGRQAWAMRAVVLSPTAVGDCRVQCCGNVFVRRRPAKRQDIE